VLGAYLAYCLRRRHELTRYWYLWLGLCASCWAAAGFIQSHGWNGSIDYGKYLIVVSFAFLTLLLFHWENMWSLPGLRWIPFLGSFSYSIYLVHFLMLDRVRAFIVPVLPPGVWRMSVSLSALLLSLAVAYLFFYFFEKPFMEKSANWKAWDKID
jgi:peptidoglycan/LPS O-acetylase OafA/YrhL